MNVNFFLTFYDFELEHLIELKFKSLRLFFFISFHHFSLVKKIEVKKFRRFLHHQTRLFLQLQENISYHINASYAIELQEDKNMKKSNLQRCYFFFPLFFHILRILQKLFKQLIMLSFLKKK